jgi:hypothetical protein
MTSSFTKLTILEEPRLTVSNMVAEHSRSHLRFVKDIAHGNVNKERDLREMKLEIADPLQGRH